MKNIKAIFSNNTYMVKLLVKTVPFYVVGSIILALLNSITGIIGDVILTKYVIDSVQYKRSFSDVLIFIAVVAAFFIITGILSSLFNTIYVPIAQQRVSMKMQNMLFKKAINTDLKYYDDPEYYNKFIISLSNADNRAFDVFNTFLNFLSSLFTISGVIAIVISVDPICILFVFIAIILSFFINMKSSKITYEQDIESKPVQRKRAYIHRVFYLIDYAKEIRISRVKNLLLKKFSSETTNMSSIVKKYSLKNFVISFANGFLINTFIIDILYFAVLIFRAAVFNTISFGSISGMINAAWTLNNSFNVIKNVIPQFSLHSMYIENLKGFMDLQSSLVQAKNAVPLPKRVSKIQLTNCSFTYPNSSIESLKNINMTINSNQKIAIVGHNGAGKSTLLKILLRFYDPNCGKVLINNVDLHEYDLQNYRNHIGTVFQDFKLFATTIGENVLMDVVPDESRNNIIEALQNSTFDSKRKLLDYDINTPFSKEFSNDGIYLSGGQEQMIALARVFIKDNLFIVLDEASSSLDPLTERRVNDKLFELAADKTVIFISHRLSITKNVDFIFVMSEGEIIESGTHNELMELKGEYARMFNIQAEKYKL